MKAASGQSRRDAVPGDPRARQASQSSRGTGSGKDSGKKLEKKPPKSNELTPEGRERIEQIYREQFATGENQWSQMVAQISDQCWLNRKVVSAVLREIVYPKVPITPEIQNRIIERYRGFVERGERPPEGRRKTISQELGIPFGQIRNIVYEWSRSQYNMSPTPELSREQKFAIEKMYLDELNKRRYSLVEMPAKIAEEVGYANIYQVLRWLDRLNDDDSRFENVSDVPPEVERQILEVYRQYLNSPTPPEKGLHATIAQQIGGLTTRKVHMVLQRYRKQLRQEYRSS
jgi:hypothetical protein